MKIPKHFGRVSSFHVVLTTKAIAMTLRKNIAVSENGFVFDPSTGDSFTLNNTALEIVELIKSGKSHNEVVTFLLEKYDADKPLIERYLVEFFEEMKTYSLIEQ